MTTDGGLDTAAELRALRAEIAALRKQVVREQEIRESVHVPQPAVSPVSRSAARKAWTAVRGGWLAVFGDVRRHP